MRKFKTNGNNNSKDELFDAESQTLLAPQIRRLDTRSIDAKLALKEPQTLRLESFLTVSNALHTKDLIPPSIPIYAIAGVSLVFCFLQAIAYWLASSAGEDYLPPGPLALFRPELVYRPLDDALVEPVSFTENWLLPTLYVFLWLYSIKEAIRYSHPSEKDKNSPDFIARTQFHPELRYPLKWKFLYNLFQSFLATLCAFIFTILTAEYSPFTNSIVNAIYISASSVAIFGMMYAGSKVVKDKIVWPFKATKKAISKCVSPNWKEFFAAEEVSSIIQQIIATNLKEALQYYEKEIALGHNNNPRIALIHSLLLENNPTLGKTFDLLVIVSGLAPRTHREKSKLRMVAYDAEKTFTKGVLPTYLKIGQCASLMGYYLLEQYTIYILMLVLADYIRKKSSEEVGDDIEYLANLPEFLWIFSIIAFSSFLVMSISAAEKVGMALYRVVKQFILGLIDLIYCCITGNHRTEPFFILNPALRAFPIFLVPTIVAMPVSWYGGATANGLTARFLTLGWGEATALSVLNFGWGIFKVIFMSTMSTAIFNLSSIPDIDEKGAEYCATMKYRNIKDHPIKNQIRTIKFVENQTDFLEKISPQQTIETVAGIQRLNEQGVYNFAPLLGNITASELITQIGEKKIIAIGLNPDDYKASIGNEKSLFKLIDDINKKFSEFDAVVHLSIRVSS